MYQKTKKLILNFLTNIFLFILLFISIQNSNKNNKVNFLSFESTKIPVGLIIGMSFFTGSFLGGTLITLNNNYKKD